MLCCTKFLLLSCIAILLSGCQQDNSGVAVEEKIVADVPVESQAGIAGGQEGETDAGGFAQTHSEDDDTSDSDQTPVVAKLAPGDKAPTLDLAVVLHGPEIRPFSGEHVMVLDFWATWCVPCLRGMPHLSDLQDQYGQQVQFIGITDETEELVTELLSKTKGDETWADLIRYSLAIDNNEQTYRNFMDAAGLRARPKVFIIDQSGTIAWIGNPAKMEDILAAIVNGDWDIQKAREEYFATPLEPVKETGARSLPALPLEPGMPAPRLQLKSVMHGPQVAEPTDSDRIQVIEFWATWCRHSLGCVETLQNTGRRFADAADIVAVTTEDSATVRSFLDGQSAGGNSWRERIRYTVAVDDNLTSWQRYMDATENMQIPCVFIVDASGQLAWIGHPRDIEQPLQQIVAGRFDVAHAAAEFRIRRELIEETQDGVTSRTHDLLTTLGNSLVDNQSIQLMHLELLSYQEMYDDYNGLAARVIEQHGNDPLAMNAIAWEIAAYQAGDRRDLDLAMSAAVLANEYTQQRDGSILDTVARVHYEQGNLTEALEWQRRAVQMVPHHRELKGTLRQYEEELAVVGASSN